MTIPEFSHREAPAFDTVLPETNELSDHAFEEFVIGDAPQEPTELNAETLTVMEPPATNELPSELASTEPIGFGEAASSNANGLSAISSEQVSVLIERDGAGPRSSNSGPGGPNGPGGNGRQEPVFGPRDRTPRGLVGTGATIASERSVQGGLEWFRRHQQADGSWSLHRHSCLDRACTCNGVGETESDAAATSFALLPYLAAGETHQGSGKYKTTVFRGLDWLIQHQKSDGNLAAGSSQTMYTHGLATIVLCEGYGLTRDRRVGEHAQAAIRFIEQSQDPETGGWWYQPKQKGGDTSVFGWQLMALKSAQMAGISVNPATLAGAQKWLKSVAKGQKNGLFEYRPNSGPTPTMTSVGVLATQYLGAPRNDPRVIEGMNFFMANMPNPRVRNCYYWYYATQVMHNLPGPEWDRWNREMRRVLIDSQIKEGCAAGSWDPNFPSVDPHGKSGGRVMVTSIAALTLEVYYRYLPLYQLETEASK